MTAKTIAHLRPRPSGNPGDGGDCTEDRVSLALEEYVKSQESAQPLTRESLLAKYSDVAGELIGCLDSLDFIRKIAPQFSDETPDDRSDVRAKLHPIADLGDFRILRELGRGGMGVVYEAEQLSLGRRVALKVLPFAAMLDKQQLARFKNEARAAATLDHPNIVAIHSVGAERGVHYYAMQLIEGRSLAEIIASMKPGRPPSFEDANQTADLIPPLTAGDTAKAALPTVKAGGSAAFSSMPPFDSREYFRVVAQLGIQAAEALDHAHQSGVLHRDIKPANLMLGEDGKLWITDFGLARIEADAGMTMTGDLLGTLRYMSPEQALAKRVVVDHRSDVYSLGVTLYELLTLQPAYAAQDRQELLRQIAFEEPRKPRQINSRIPGDLETTILKAIEKNPAERYATAREFADDLKRFAEDRPIKARRTSFVGAARKWCWRHRPVVWAAAAVLLVSAFAVAGSLGWIARDRAARRIVLDEQIEQAVNESETWYEAGKISEAVSGVKRAAGLAASGGSKALQQRVGQWRADLEMVKRLEQIQLDQALPALELSTADSEATSGAKEFAAETESGESDDGTAPFDRKRAVRSYQDAFRQYGIDLEALNVEQAAERIGNSPVKQALVAALDDWHQATNFDVDSQFGDHDVKIKSSASTGLLQIARLADPDPWRDRLRDAIQRDDDAVLKELANEQDVNLQPVPTVLLLTRALKTRSQEGAGAEAEKILRAARQERPSDFWLNLELARCLASDKSLDESIGYRRVAVALRPDSPGALTLLASGLQRRGVFAEAEAVTRTALRLAPDLLAAHAIAAKLLLQQKRYLEAEAACRETIRVAPADYKAHEILSKALTAQKKYVEAEAAVREAVRLAPTLVAPHGRLCDVLIAQHKFQEAEAAAREAIRLFSADHRAHYNLGIVLNHQKKYSESAAAFREAIRVTPSANSHYNLGTLLLLHLKKYPEAEAALREATRLDPSDPAKYINLAVALDKQKRYVEAEAVGREAIRHHPAIASLHYNLGATLTVLKKYPKAEATLREATRLDPSNPAYHNNLGMVLYRQQRYPEAEAAFREAIRVNPDFEKSVAPELAIAIAKDAESTGNAVRWDEAAAEFAREIDLREDTTVGLTPLKLCRIAAQWDQVFDRLIKLRPDDPTLWIGRGQYYTLRGRWPDAAAAYAKVIHSRELSWETIEYAFLLVMVEDVEGYEQFCREHVDRVSDRTLVGQEPYFISYVCAARPSNVVDSSRLVEWAAAGANAFVHPSSKHNLGLAQYRAGQYKLAIESLKLSNASTKWQEFPKAQNWLVLAMALHRLGDADEARQCLETARQKIAQLTQSNTELEEYRSSGAADDWICVHVLLREAEAVLSKRPPSDHKPPTPNPNSDSSNTTLEPKPMD